MSRRSTFSSSRVIPDRSNNSAPFRCVSTAAKEPAANRLYDGLLKRVSRAKACQFRAAHMPRCLRRCPGARWGHRCCRGPWREVWQPNRRGESLRRAERRCGAQGGCIRQCGCICRGIDAGTRRYPRGGAHFPVSRSGGTSGTGHPFATRSEAALVWRQRRESLNLLSALGRQLGYTSLGIRSFLARHPFSRVNWVSNSF
jgi:hypothetical protein